MSTAYAASSLDGVTWTLRSLPAGGNWVKVVHNGTVFLAIQGGPGTASSICATSTDGINWTQQAMSSSRQWTGLCWDGTYFIAVCGQGGFSNKICARSTTGATGTWTEFAMSNLTWTANWTVAAITSPSPLLCVVCTTGGGITGTSSDHGATWTLNSTTGVTGFSGGGPIAAKAGTFVILLPNSSGQACSSTDGIAWVAHTITASSSAWSSLKWNRTGLFTAPGNGTQHYAYSADGLSWTFRSNVLPSAHAWIGAVNNPYSSEAIISGDVGSTAAAITDPSESSEGSAWLPGTLPVSTTWTDIEWNGNTGAGSILVAISNSTVASFSPDEDFWDPLNLLSRRSWVNYQSFLSNILGILSFGGSSGGDDGGIIVTPAPSEIVVIPSLVQFPPGKRTRGASAVGVPSGGVLALPPLQVGMLRAANAALLDRKPYDGSMSQVYCAWVAEEYDNWFQDAVAGGLTVGSTLDLDTFAAGLRPAAFAGWGQTFLLYINSVVWAPGGPMVGFIPGSPSAPAASAALQLQLTAITVAGFSGALRTTKQFADTIGALLYTYTKGIVVTALATGPGAPVPTPVPVT